MGMGREGGRGGRGPNTWVWGGREGGEVLIHGYGEGGREGRS